MFLSFSNLINLEQYGQFVRVIISYVFLFDFLPESKSFLFFRTDILRLLFFGERDFKVFIFFFLE
jgi:hypothetical protein